MDVNPYKENNKKIGFSIASLILSAVPFAVMLMGFLFCLIISGGKLGDNDAGAVWWLFVAMIWMFVPVAPITGILSAILGVIGLKGKKSVFGWTGIIFASLNILVLLLIFGWLLLG